MPLERDMESHYLRVPEISMMGCSTIFCIVYGFSAVAIDATIFNGLSFSVKTESLFKYHK